MNKKGLAGGFNPFEKYLPNGIISPSRGENSWNHHLDEKYLQLPNPQQQTQPIRGKTTSMRLSGVDLKKNSPAKCLVKMQE